MKLNRVLIIAFMANGFVCTSANADINLTFGTYAAVKPTATAHKFMPFLDYLAQEMAPILG